MDFEESFSPIAKIETVRVFLALVELQKWPIFHLDIKTALLNGKLQEEVIVDHAEGFIAEN